MTTNLRTFQNSELLAIEGKFLMFYVTCIRSLKNVTWSWL